MSLRRWQYASNRTCSARIDIGCVPRSPIGSIVSDIGGSCSHRDDVGDLPAVRLVLVEHRRRSSTSRRSATGPSIAASVPPLTSGICDGSTTPCRMLRHVRDDIAHGPTRAVPTARSTRRRVRLCSDLERGRRARPAVLRHPCWLMPTSPSSRAHPSRFGGGRARGPSSSPVAHRRRRRASRHRVARRCVAICATWSQSQLVPTRDAARSALDAPAVEVLVGAGALDDEEGRVVTGGGRGPARLGSLAGHAVDQALCPLRSCFSMS